MKKRYIFALISFTLLIILTAIIVIETNKNNAPIDSRADSVIASEVWMHPNYHYDFPSNYGSSEWGAYFKDPSYIKSTAPYFDVFSLFVLQVYKNEGNFLQGLISQLKANNKKLAVESFGFPTVQIDPSTGNLIPITCDSQRVNIAIRTELQMLDKIYAAGGRVDYLTLDDPLGRLIRGSQYEPYYPSDCQVTAETAINYIVQYMNGIKAKYPNIKIGIISNFPNWRYGNYKSYTLDRDYGDYKVILNNLVNKINNSGNKLWYIHADYPYDYAIGTAAGVNPKGDGINRLMELQAQAKSLNLSFGLTYNSSDAGLSGNNSSYFQKTLKYLSLFRSKAGNPSHLIVESWYPHPTKLFPISEQFTFSNLMLYVNKLGYANNIVNSDKSSVYRLSNSKGYFFYTSNTYELDQKLANENYFLDGIAFSIPNQKSKETSLVSVHRLKNGFEGYLYTVNNTEAQSAVSQYGYKSDGISFTALKDKGITNSALPVFRLRGVNQPGNYLYTLNEFEKQNAVQSGDFILEGIAFYAYM